MEEKRKIIKKIYKILHYDDLPQLYSMTELESKEGITIYRGISANNNDKLKKYINEFINGEAFYGGRASIYGTGIYTVAGENLSVASKYASDGGINNCGIVIESKYRNKGYSKPALKLLCKEAFENGIDALYDTFEKDRDNTVKTFESVGFKIIEETNWKKFGKDVEGVIVCIRKCDFNENN